MEEGGRPKAHNHVYTILSVSRKHVKNVNRRTKSSRRRAVRAAYRLYNENDGGTKYTTGEFKGDRTAGQKAKRFLNKRFTETSICSKVEQDKETGRK